MKKLFEQIEANKINPTVTNWYNTDEGELYWFNSEKVWSCRDDMVSEEYPKYWYSVAHSEQEQGKSAEDMLPLNMTIYNQANGHDYAEFCEYFNKVRDALSQIKQPETVSREELRKELIKFIEDYSKQYSDELKDADSMIVMCDAVQFVLPDIESVDKYLSQKVNNKTK